MAEWDVEYEIVGTAYRVIEADTEQEALALALEHRGDVDESHVSFVSDAKVVRARTFLPAEPSEPSS